MVFIFIHENTLAGIKVIERTQLLQEKIQRGIIRLHVGGVLVFVLCTSSDDGLHLF